MSSEKTSLEMTGRAPLTEGNGGGRPERPRRHGGGTKDGRKRCVSIDVGKCVSTCVTSHAHSEIHPHKQTDT